MCCSLVFCSTFLVRFLEHLHYVVFKCVAAEKIIIRILGLLSCVLPKFLHFAILFPPSCLPSNKVISRSPQGKSAKTHM